MKSLTENEQLICTLFDLGEIFFTSNYDFLIKREKINREINSQSFVPF